MALVILFQNRLPSYQNHTFSQYDNYYCCEAIECFISEHFFNIVFITTADIVSVSQVCLKIKYSLCWLCR